MKALDRIDGSLARLEGWFLVVLIIGMTGLSFLQVVLRNLFQTGLIWADPMNRHLVLWVGFFGAALAASQGKHITIDVLSRFIPPGLKKFVDILINAFGAVICAVLTNASIEFIQMEMEMGATLFLDIPTWIVLIIIPAGFAVILVHFLIHLIRCTGKLFSRGTV